MFGLSQIATGGIKGIIEGVTDIADRFITTSDEKNQFLVMLKELENKQVEITGKRANEAEKNLNERIREQEGTAKDLLGLPLVGRVIIFFRGVQRPAWGFMTLYFDYVIFTNQATVKLMTETRVVDGVLAPAQWTPEGLLIVCINILVLGFLFGERAVKNLEPLLTKIFAKKD